MIQELTPQVLFQLILWVTLIVPALTLPVSWVLLRLYHRAVLRAMAAVATGTDAQPAEAVPQPAAFSTPEPAARLRLRTVYGPWWSAARYALAGLAFASIITLGFFVLFRFRLQPLYFLAVWWVFSWPVVLTVNFVVPSGWRMKWTTVLAYFVALAGFGQLAALTPLSPLNPLAVAWLWSVLNLPPTVLLLAFFSRRVRAVGPLVLSFMTVAVAGSTLGFWAMFYRGAADKVIALTVALRMSVYWTLIGGAALAFAGFGGLGWLLALWIRRGYQRKGISDQSLALDAVWLLFAASDSILLALGGLRWALTGVVAFLVYKLVARLGARLSSAHAAPRCTALLFLRVFALGKRSSLLFEAVTKPWRHAGSIQFITGPDLATSTVEPHQFLEFLTGKLAQLFISGQASLDRRMELLDSRPDADGRFRVNHFFCHADTWQGAVARLVRGSEVVLMDLRSFSPRNAGCVRELKELVNVTPLDRLVLVIDETTERSFLDETLESVWRAMPPASPNRDRPRSDLHLFQLDSVGAAEHRRLLHRLCLAAGRKPQGKTFSPLSQ